MKIMLTPEQNMSIAERFADFNRKSGMSLSSGPILNFIKEVFEVPEETTGYEDSLVMMEQDCNLLTAKFLESVADYVVQYQSIKKDLRAQEGSIDQNLMELTKGVLTDVLNPYCNGNLEGCLEALDDAYEDYGDIFKKGINSYLDKNAKSKYDLISPVVFATVAAEDDGMKAAEYSGKLLQQLKDYENVAEEDVKSQDAKTRNHNFEDFMQSASLNYRMVHDLYNQKNIFQKWFTASGWALRSAMNAAKAVAKDYYDKVAKANDHDSLFDDKLKLERIETRDFHIVPTKLQKFDISKTFADFTKNQKVRLQITEDFNIEKEEIVRFDDEWILPPEEMVNGFDDEKSNEDPSPNTLKTQDEDDEFIPEK